LLSEALKSDRELVRSECLNALGGVGEPAKAILNQITEIAESDDSPVVRAAALHAMGRLKADSLQAVQAALAALDDDVVVVRNAAHFMIGSLGESARSAAPQLQETMRTGEPFERVVAAWALVRVAPSEENGRVAAPFMVSALQNADPRVRLEAAQTLGTIGIDTPEVVAGLNAAASDEDAEVAAAARASLQQLH
jgi:HEAT repeat protein